MKSDGVPLRVLCIEPHNDDCGIGVGGAILKLVETGADVHFGYMTDGRHGSENIPPVRLSRLRKLEAERERRILGVDSAFDLGVEDGMLGSLTKLEKGEVVQFIADYMREKSPNVVFIPSRGEGHPDHRAAHDLAIESCTRARMKPVIVKYSVWFLPPFYSEARIADPTDSVYMVGIDQQLKKKMRAIGQHESQVRRGRYDVRAKAMSNYLGLALKAFDTIQSEYVEVIGISGTKSNTTTLARLLRGLQPCIDVTELVHGRRRKRIISGSRTTRRRR